VIIVVFLKSIALPPWQHTQAAFIGNYQRQQQQQQRRCQHLYVRLAMTTEAVSSAGACYNTTCTRSYM